MEVWWVVMAFLCSVGFLLRLSFYPKWGVALTTIAFTIWIWWAFIWVLRQSRNDFELYMSQSAVVQNCCLFINIDSFLLLLFAWIRVPKYKDNNVRRAIQVLTAFYPGLLFGIVQVFVVAMLLYSYPGHDFMLLHYGIILCFLLGIPAGTWCLSRLFTNEAFRLELLFICVFITILLSVFWSGYYSFI